LKVEVAVAVEGEGPGFVSAGDQAKYRIEAAHAIIKKESRSLTLLLTLPFLRLRDFGLPLIDHYHLRQK